MRIAILPGDGIGKEVTAQAVKVLQAALGNSHRYELREARIGGAGLDSSGDALPPGTLELARNADAILVGATGVPEDEHRPPQQGAGAGLLRLRKELCLFANFRPIFLFRELAGASTLKAEVLQGLDLLIIRELTGDLYYGQPRGIATSPSGEGTGFNTMRYSESEVERIAHLAFQAARRRRNKVCSVDKASVLETSALWREVMVRVGGAYSDVELSHMYVDTAAMALMRHPKRFDVIVTGSLFGEILTGAAAMLTGSIGMLPSASVGSGRRGIYEPVHGTAPDIAGKDVANPLAAILSVSMMLRHSFGLQEQAAAIEHGVRAVLRDGYRTVDIFQPGMRRVGTQEMGDLVADAIARTLH